MSDQEGKRLRALVAWLWLGPAIALGLYAGRILSEWLHPGISGALILTGATIAVSAFAVRRIAVWHTWPLMLLLTYALFPEPDPRMALGAGLAALFGTLLVADLSRLSSRLAGTGVDVVTGLLLGAGFLIIYIHTLAPDVLPADSGELQLVAAKLGVAHPPGFPLYTMLANLVTRMPIGENEAYRTNLLSAIMGASTVSLVYLSVQKLGRSRLAALLAGAALGTSATFWSVATTTNVRSLTALFTAALLYLLLVLGDRQRQAGQERPEEARERDDLQDRPSFWLLALNVFVLVLAVTHHSSLIFIGGLFLLYAVMAQPKVVGRPHRWLVLILAAIIALLPLLYLPQRGGAGAIGAPEDLTTPAGFLQHVLGLGFRGDLFYFDQPAVLWSRLAVMMNVLTFQFSPFMLVVMLLGLILLIRRDRLLGIVVAASIIVHTLVAAVYRAPQTVEYMVPVYVLLAFLLGMAGSYLRQFTAPAEKNTARDGVRSVAAVLLLVAMMMAVIAQAAQNYRSYRWLSQDRTARAYAQPLLDAAPAESVILADWHWATPLWYLQYVEGQRPDVETVFVFPGSEAYARTWARMIEEELTSGRPVIATHYEAAAYADLPQAEPLLEAYLYQLEPRTTLPEGFVSTSVELDPNLRIVGYKLYADSVEAGRELVVDVAWQPEGELAPGTTLYAHLIGQDGKLYAGDDQHVEPREDGLTISQFRLTPLLGTPPGTYDLALGSYGSDGPKAENRVWLSQVPVERMSMPPFTQNRAYRPLVDQAEDRTLIGYDWDATMADRPRLYLHWSTEGGYETSSVDSGDRYEMPRWYGPWGIERANSTLALGQPTSYVPFGQGVVWLGQTVTAEETVRPTERAAVPLDFTTSRPVMRDLVVSVRLVGYQDDSSDWAWWDLDDGVPAMGAIPTLKWIAGSRVRHPVWSTVSADAWEGQVVEPLVILYDAFTSRRLPLLDERFAQDGPWLPLGKTTVER